MECGGVTVVAIKSHTIHNANAVQVTHDAFIDFVEKPVLNIIMWNDIGLWYYKLQCNILLK